MDMGRLRCRRCPLSATFAVLVVLVAWSRLGDAQDLHRGQLQPDSPTIEAQGLSSGEGVEDKQPIGDAVKDKPTEELVEERNQAGEEEEDESDPEPPNKNDDPRAEIDTSHATPETSEQENEPTPSEQSAETDQSESNPEGVNTSAENHNKEAVENELETPGKEGSSTESQGSSPTEGAMENFENANEAEIQTGETADEKEESTSETPLEEDMTDGESETADQSAAAQAKVPPSPKVQETQPAPDPDLEYMDLDNPSPAKIESPSKSQDDTATSKEEEEDDEDVDPSQRNETVVEPESTSEKATHVPNDESLVLDDTQTETTSPEPAASSETIESDDNTVDQDTTTADSMTEQAPKTPLDASEESTNSNFYSGTWGLYMVEKRYANLETLGLLFDRQLVGDANNRYNKVFQPVDDLIIPTLHSKYMGGGDGTPDGASTTILTDPTEDSGSPRSVNAEFVEGLDDLDKFFEGVDPPDELDVGAAGTSIQDVLMGQTSKIIIKRISVGAQYVVKGCKAVKNRIAELLADEDRKLPEINKEQLVKAKDWVVARGKEGFHYAKDLVKDLLSNDDDLDLGGDEFQNYANDLESRLRELQAKTG